MEVSPYAWRSAKLSCGESIFGWVQGVQGDQPSVLVAVVAHLDEMLLEAFRDFRELYPEA